MPPINDTQPRHPFHLLIYSILFIFVVACIFYSPAAYSFDINPSAQARGAFDGDDPRVETFLLLDTTTARPGDTILAGVVFRMDPQWHIYWKNAGQGGLATDIIFEAEPAHIGSTKWPSPTIYADGAGEIITFGYDTETLLYTDITIPEDFDGLTLKISADVDYLVCKIDCIPGQHLLETTLDIGDKRQPASNDITQRFEHYRAQLPKDATAENISFQSTLSTNAVAPSQQFDLTIDIITCNTADDVPNSCIQLAPPPEAIFTFAHEGIDGIHFDITRATPHPSAYSGWQIHLSGRASPDPPRDVQNTLHGVARLLNSSGDIIPIATTTSIVRTSVPLEETSTQQPAAPSSGGPHRDDISLFSVLFLAFLGGMLLNLMPCVFPILAIKLFAITSLAHKDRRTVATHGAAYTAGIISAMLALAGAVILLQTIGTYVGWGFQFQDPRYVVAVSIILVLFALNLFDVFQISVSATTIQEKVDHTDAGMSRSFGEGILAVILATPCSAPFLGTAVGFALASPTYVIVSVFIALGLGLALPFVIVSLVPGLQRILPKPGPWMKYFKQFLGFALLGTTLWLLWLIGQFAGAVGIISVIILLLTVAIATWVYGLIQYRNWPIKAPIMVSLISVVITVGWLILPTLQETPQFTSNDTTVETSSWQPYSEENVRHKLSLGQPVFINFTADWCITCKVNERRVLSQPEIMAAFSKHNVALFKGDWTRRDDVIRQKLATFGKAGVPLYLLYPPNNPENPIILPELLTQQRVLDELNRLDELSP